MKTISGGNALGLDSNNARKRYPRQIYNLHEFNPAKKTMPLLFTEEDNEDVRYPHEDLLIINPIIEENKIWKIQVDEGSSANILFYLIYYKMNLVGQQMILCHEAPLEAFGV